MTKRQTLAGSLVIVGLAAGCQSTAHERFSYNNPSPCEQPKVTVRFVNQPGLAFVTNCQQHDTQLVSDESKPCGWNSIFQSDFFKCKDSQSSMAQTRTTTDLSSPCSPCGRPAVVTPCNMGGFAQGTDFMPQHAVLWGRGHNGCDVTAFPTALDPGSYTFAYFDPDRGTAYQGWMAINSGGDDVLSSLTEWRDTVHRQEEWLAFENKIHGKYASHDHADFKRFSNELANLRRLENKINAAIYAEQKDRQQMYQWRNDYLGDAEVVLMPGPAYNFAQPMTLPAFQPADLSAAQGGQPITKVILAGDFARSMEKLDRLTDLQNEMRRCRAVLNEEVVRLENRRSYFRLTSHLFDHDNNFMGNEQRVQQARGMLANLDRQITENRRHGHAILTVVGLFAPEEANLAFAREQAEIRAERAIWAERLNQVEMQFSDASTWSEKRIALEGQRQYLMLQLAECDTQLDQCGQAADTVAQLRQNTGVIYRNGPASILAASFMTDSVPARLADAIEKESMMTIRLHSAEGIRPTPKHLTEGSTINEQMFMLTGDTPEAGQYGIYNYNENESDNDQQILNEWSNTQRNYGQPNPNPSNCGPSHSDQP
jgi:hypothetical protein